MKNGILHIMHLADSALPVGGYAYSNGLEFALKSGLIGNVDALEQYLVSYITQASNFDLSFVKAAYMANGRSQLKEVSVLYNAMLLNSSIKKSGLVLGKNWLRLIKQLYINNPEVFFEKNVDPDFPIVYGSVGIKIGIRLNEICMLYYYMLIRDQLSAVIRLGTLGPGAAHKIQHDLLQTIKEKFDVNKIPDCDKAVKSAYLLEIAQLSHPKLYTKLFQN